MSYNDKLAELYTVSKIISVESTVSQKVCHPNHGYNFVSS